MNDADELTKPCYPLVPVGSHGDAGMYWIDRWCVEHATLELRSALADIRLFLGWSPVLSESYRVRQRGLARAVVRVRLTRRNLRVWVRNMVGLP